MIQRVLLIASLLGLLSCGPVGCLETSALTGKERWQKVLDIVPERRESWAPTLSPSADRLRPGEALTLTIVAREQTYFYLFLLLPNNDLYLLAPSPKIKDHKGSVLSIPPIDADFELFAPELPGEFRFAVIASEQNVNLLSEGWLRASGNRDFDTWPADQPLNRALEFIRQTLADRPWSLATATVTVLEPASE